MQSHACVKAFKSADAHVADVAKQPANPARIVAMVDRERPDLPFPSPLLEPGLLRAAEFALALLFVVHALEVVGRQAIERAHAVACFAVTGHGVLLVPVQDVISTLLIEFWVRLLIGSRASVGFLTLFWIVGDVIPHVIRMRCSLLFQSKLLSVFTLAAACSCLDPFSMLGMIPIILLTCLSITNLTVFPIVTAHCIRPVELRQGFGFVAFAARSGFHCYTFPVHTLGIALDG